MKFSKKKKVFTGKTPFFVIHFVLPSLFVLTFWQGSFVWKCIIFMEIYFKVKVLETQVIVIQKVLSN